MLDATTGQNALNQAKEFKKCRRTHRHCSDQAGWYCAGRSGDRHQRRVGVPIKYIGVGEGIDDLQPFAAREFVDALFEKDQNGVEA